MTFRALVFVWLSAAGALAAVPQFHYFPEHTVGNISVSVYPFRYLEVAWFGRNIMTIGAELFTREYKPAGLNGVQNSDGPMGSYWINDALPEFDVPILVDTTGDLTYTWVCDASISGGYKQVNRAVMQSNRVTLTSTITISNSIPSEIRVHPVFFPGSLSMTSSTAGSPDPYLPGTSFSLTDTNGVTVAAVYPTNAPAVIWGTNVVTFNATFAEGPVRITFRSDGITNINAQLYALAIWPQTTPGESGRNGLVADISLAPGTYTRTWETVIEVADISGAVPSGAPSPVLADGIILTPALPSGTNFWFFRPSESVICNLLLDNRSSTNAKSFVLNCDLIGYDNVVRSSTSVTTNVPALTMLTNVFNFGTLDRGAYILDFNALTNGVPIGHTALRVGVVPATPIVDAANSLGGFSYSVSNFAQQLDLMHWIGMGKIRYRTGTHDQMWRVFEPTSGGYTPDATAIANAALAKTNGFYVIYSGEEEPLLMDDKPTWLTDPEVTQFTYATLFGNGYFPTNITLFNNYMQRWSTNYSGIVPAFEVFNEPQRTMAISNAVRVIQLMRTNIQLSIPTAQIACCDINEATGPKFVWWTNVMALANADVDIITYHQYIPGYWLKRSAAKRFPVLEDSAWEAQIRDIAAVGARYGKTNIWNGETAWLGFYSELFPLSTFSASEIDTANTLIRSYLLGRYNGATSFMQTFAPTYRRLNSSYGIHERAGSAVGWDAMVKPWAVAHATLSELLDSASFVTRVNVNDPTVYILCFDQPNSRFAAIWSSRGSAYLSNPFDSGDAIFRSVVGQSLSPDETIPISQAPIYILGYGLSKTDFQEKLNLTHITGQANYKRVRRKL